MRSIVTSLNNARKSSSKYTGGNPILPIESKWKNFKNTSFFSSMAEEKSSNSSVLREIDEDDEVEKDFGGNVSILNSDTSTRRDMREYEARRDGCSSEEEEEDTNKLTAFDNGEENEEVDDNVEYALPSYAPLEDFNNNDNDEEEFCEFVSFTNTAVPPSSGCNPLASCDAEGEEIVLSDFARFDDEDFSPLPTPPPAAARIGIPPLTQGISRKKLNLWIQCLQVEFVYY